MTTSPQSSEPQPSELPSRTRLIAAISARPKPVGRSCHEYQSMTLTQKLAMCWNMIQNIRQDLNRENYEKTNIILQQLDEILLDLSPCLTDEPVPLPYTKCGDCCDDHA